MDEPDTLDGGELFEAIRSCLGARMRESDLLCNAIWGALTNVEWIHESGRSALYTFRGAAGLIADVIERGDYLDWYCCGPTGVISDEIRAALKAQGWIPVIQEKR